MPFLDAYDISGEAQSMIWEAIFWTVLYLGYASGWSHVVRAMHRPTKLWKMAGKRGGLFSGNGRDDCVLWTLLGVHHITAGLLMLLGVLHSDPILWRHGYLLETGLEVADTLAFLFGLYPYGRHDGFKPEMQAAMMFHHLPGMLMAPFVMSQGLYANPHLQQIGFWMLAGAAVSCFAGIYTYSLDMERQIVQATVALVVNTAFFLYCRLYIFPVESWNVLQDVKSDEVLGQNSVLIGIMYFGAIALSIFNIACVADLIPKNYRYIKRCLDGVTPIDDGPVPPSRDSLLGIRRRSTIILQAVEAIDSRRSSLSDVVLMQPPTTLLDDSALSEEDQTAMNRTLSKMSSNDKKVR